MDKTIRIDNRQVLFRKTGGTALRYKRQFGRELNADLEKIYAVYHDLVKNNDGAQKSDDAEKDAAIHAMLGVETEWMYDIAYTMAQQADPTITNELDWLDSFNVFNIWAVFMELFDLIKEEMRVHPKNA